MTEGEYPAEFAVDRQTAPVLARLSCFATLDLDAPNDRRDYSTITHLARIMTHSLAEGKPISEDTLSVLEKALEGVTKRVTWDNKGYVLERAREFAQRLGNARTATPLEIGTLRGYFLKLSEALAEHGGSDLPAEFLEALVV